MFELLMRRHNTALYRMGKAFGFVHHDIEDLMQEAHLAAYSHLHEFKGISSYKTWLIQIMLNKCRQRQNLNMRRERRMTEMKDSEGLVNLEGSAENDTTRKILNRELSLILEEAINHLPIIYRMVFTLRELNGLSIADTANVLSITETNVKVRLNRAKALLRKQIEKYYSPDDISEFSQTDCDRVVERVMDEIKLIKMDVSTMLRESPEPAKERKWSA